MVFNKIMNTEKSTDTKTKNFIDSKNDEKKISGRVDINHLIARVKVQRQKERKSNLISFGLFATLTVIVVTILSY